MRLKNITHPSLHAKKYDEIKDIWQGVDVGFEPGHLWLPVKRITG